MASLVTAQCLTATLSSDSKTRISTELKLTEILCAPGSFLSRPHCGRRRLMSRRVHPEAGVAVLQLVLASDVELSLRQMSFVASLWYWTFLDGLIRSHTLQCYHPPQIVCHRTLVPVLPAVQRFRAVTRGMFSAVITVAALLGGVVACG